MGLIFTMQQKHNSTHMSSFLGTMNYNQLMLMIDPISNGDLRAYGGMELISGGLDLMMKKECHMATDIMMTTNFAPISYLRTDGGCGMVKIGRKEEIILS